MRIIKEKEFEKIFKALANRRRLEIITFIKRKEEAPVGEIAHAIKLSFRSTSRHLAILFGADILEREQRTVQVFYRITKEFSKIKRALANEW